MNAVAFTALKSYIFNFIGVNAVAFTALKSYIFIFLIGVNAVAFTALKSYVFGVNAASIHSFEIL